MNWSTGSRLQLACIIVCVVWLQTKEASAGASNACTGVAEVAAGNLHTCAVMQDGTARCWGYNGYGQLEDGTTTSSAVPVVVPGLSSVRSISAGMYHTCAVLENGTASCWGYNQNAQLGDGTFTERSMHVPVPGLSNVRSISAGYYHTCAVLENGSASCWGFNGRGQLGDGTDINRNIPVVVSGLSNVRSITTAEEHTCAVSEDGTAHCWGYAHYGPLGIGTPSSYVPMVVLGLSNVHIFPLDAVTHALCWRMALHAVGETTMAVSWVMAAASTQMRPWWCRT